MGIGIGFRPSLDVVQRNRREADFLHDGRDVHRLLAFHRGEGIPNI